MACMDASASAGLFACHDVSITHDVHAKHAQVLGVEGLCQEMLSGGLNGRAGDDWIGTCGRLKGPMTLVIRFVQAFTIFCASHALHAHACITLCMQSSCLPRGREDQIFVECIKSIRVVCCYGVVASWRRNFQAKCMVYK